MSGLKAHLSYMKNTVSYSYCTVVVFLNILCTRDVFGLFVLLLLLYIYIIRNGI